MSSKLIGRRLTHSRSFNPFIKTAGVDKAPPAGQKKNPPGQSGAAPQSGRQTIGDATGIAVLTNGAVVMAGENWDGTFRNSIMLRFNKQLNIDNTFGDAGSGMDVSHVISQIVLSNAVVQTDQNGVQKILAAGWNGNVPHNIQFMIMRYDSSGKLDPTFGNSNPKDGFAISGLNTNTNFGYNLAMLPDQSLIVVGFVGEFDDSNNLVGPFGYGVAHFSKDGIFDGAFGDNRDMPGCAFPVLDYGFDSRIQMDAVVADGNGGIIIAGAIPSAAPDADGVWPGATAAITRLDLQGNVDRNFGNSGLVTKTFPRSAFSTFVAVAMDGSGGIILAGTGDPDVGSDLFMVRFDMNANAFDLSFGGTGTGVVTASPGPIAQNFYPAGIVIQNKQIAVGGTASSNGTGVFALLQFTLDGKPSGTPIITPFNGSDGLSHDAWVCGIVGDGNKLILGGTSSLGDSSRLNDFLVARY